MIRVNFLAKRRRAPFTLAAAGFDPSLRAPLTALAGTLVCAGILYGVQAVRLHDVQRRLSAAQAHVWASDAAVRDIRALEAEVTARWALAADVAEVQRANVRRANELASIGNVLPRNAWLVSLRLDRGAFALEGRSTSLSAVAAAMRSLRAASAAGTARLMSINDDPGLGREHVRFTLRIENGRP